MKSISHSQFTSYNECNLKWKLRYIDELSDSQVVDKEINAMAMLIELLGVVK